ncbi:hypothetical protein EDB83DRAFT_2488357 [Lactarius deliciosus]|nr:hypothetical protein EDB83DRAFT_2488357 [Lactarius deliciosus]
MASRTSARTTLQRPALAFAPHGDCFRSLQYPALAWLTAFLISPAPTPALAMYVVVVTPRRPARSTCRSACAQLAQVQVVGLRRGLVAVRLRRCLTPHRPRCPFVSQTPSIGAVVPPNMTKTAPTSMVVRSVYALVPWKSAGASSGAHAGAPRRLVRAHAAEKSRSAE